MLEPVPPILSPRGITSIIVASVFWFLSATLLLLRLFTNIRIRRLITTSDWTIIAAFLFSSAFNIITILVCLYGGMGFHADAIDPAYMRNNFKLSLGAQVAYALSLSLSKCSICLLISTIFPIRPVRIAARAIVTLCILWAIGIILVAFLTCRPLSYNWAPTGTEGKCTNVVPAWTGIGALDVVLDGAILILPIPMLAKLKMHFARKLAVSSVFVLGFITLVVGIIRTATVAHVGLADFSYEGYYAYVWSTVEPAIAATVACMMTLRPLGQLYWPAVREFLHLPVLGTDDITYTDTAERTSHQGYRISISSSQQDSHAVGLALGHGETFLNMSDDEDDYETTTGAPSSIDRSNPSTPAHSQKMKGHGRAKSREDDDRDPESPIFSIGATPALPPPAKTRRRG